MASATITPPVSAPAAPSTPAAAPAPAATPSAPTATETTTPTTPVTTPTDSAPAEPVSLEERISQGWQKAKDSVPLEEEQAEDAPATEAPPVEDAPAAEVPAVEDAPKLETAPETTDATAEAWDLDDDGTAGDPAAFFNEANKNPEVKKFFDENQTLKNAVAGALRRDKENREIRDFIPTVDAAREAVQGASLYVSFDNAYLQAETDPKPFLDKLVEQSIILDDKGQPVKDENGKYKPHPSLTKIIDHISGNKISTIAEQIKSNGIMPGQLSPIVDAIRSFALTKGDERLEAVADVLKEMLSPSSSAQEELPPELKAQADRLKAKETALDEKEQAAERQRQAEKRTAHLQSIEKAETKASDSVEAQLKSRFAASGLTEFEQTSALREIGEAIDAKLGHQNEDGSWTPGSSPASRMFQSVYDSIIRNNPPGEARENKLTKHLMTYTQQILGPIATQVIRQAKQGTLTRQAEKQTTVDAQKITSRTDPRGTSIAASSPTAQNPAQLRAQVIKDLTTQLGREPDMGEIMKESWRRSQVKK